VECQVHLAALYDIHGNLPALEAVLRDLRESDAEEIVVGGDVVPGPMSRDCLECLLNVDLPIRFLSGNCERELLALDTPRQSTRLPERILAAMRWTAEQLDDAARSTLAEWPATLRVRHESLGEVLFCHGTPRSDSEIFTRSTPEELLRPVFDQARAAVVVCGHTHMQFDRMIGRTRVVNAGSVGMPFQTPAAYWLLLGETLELRRTAYDLERAAARIRESPYPDAAEFADRNLLNPPAETEMLELYSRLALEAFTRERADERADPARRSG
jgi:predicted phosphodiesterase